MWTSLVSALEHSASGGLSASAAPKIVVFLAADVPPFSFMKDGEPAGINVDIVKHAAQALGYQASFKILPLKRARAMLEGSSDYFLLGFARTPERELSVTWVAPLVPTKIAMHNLQHHIALPNKRRAEVCAHYGTPMEDWLKRSQHPDYMIVTSEQACLKLLNNHLVKYWFTETHLAQYLFQQSKLASGSLIEGRVMMSPQLYLAANINTPRARVLAWRQQLEGMAERGEFERITKQYVDNY